MYALKRELKLNNKECSLMRGIAGFKRFVYNYALDLITASWEFEGKKLKVRASKNARKYYIKLARQHARIANIRRDTTQKMTTDLSSRAYIIRIEDLNIQGMIANHKLAAAVMELKKES